jgi:hypothetical protein
VAAVAVVQLLDSRAYRYATHGVHGCNCKAVVAAKLCTCTSLCMCSCPQVQRIMCNVMCATDTTMCI